tara:strand:+ start:109472 stop:109873 length:402 start_codon:yes stop_codon:yes gene_type:complete
MKISIIAIFGGAAMAGILTMHNPASSEVTDQRFATDSPAIVDPDDVPDIDPDVEVAQAIEVSGTVLDVGAASIVINGAGVTPVTIAVPPTAEIIRDGQKAELSDLMPGDLADVDAVRKNGKLTATTVDAHTLL